MEVADTTTRSSEWACHGSNRYPRLGRASRDSPYRLAACLGQTNHPLGLASKRERKRKQRERQRQRARARERERERERERALADHTLRKTLQTPCRQSDSRSLGNTLCLKVPAVALRFNEIQVYAADGSVIPSTAMTTQTTSNAVVGGNLLPLSGCFDGNINSAGCGTGDADLAPSITVNMTCGTSGEITAGVSRVVIHNTVADSTRATSLTVQAVNSGGGVYDTFVLQGPAATYEFWMSKDVCRPGQGGAACNTCAFGFYSAAASPTTPKPDCLACPSGNTTASTGGQSVGMCSGACKGCACPWFAAMVKAGGLLAQMPTVTDTACAHPRTLRKHLKSNTRAASQVCVDRYTCTSA